MEPVRVVSGGVHELDRANVDTDQIIPKQFLKRIERTGFGEYLFHDWRKEGLTLDPECPILATGPNFGCGSSREHAVWALRDFGFRAIVAPSFADIFYTNCGKSGLLAVTLPQEEVHGLMQAREGIVDLERQVVEFGGREVPFEIHPELRERLLQGQDEIAPTLERIDEIERFEAERAPAGSLTTSLG